MNAMLGSTLTSSDSSSPQDPALTPSPQAKRGRRRWLLALGLALSVGLGILAFRTLDARELWSGITQVNPLAFLIFVSLRGLNFLVPALRTRILMGGMSSISFWRLTKSVLLAFAVNNVVPFRAGEVVRVAYLSRFGSIPISSAAGIVGFERMLDALTLLSIVSICIPLVTIELPKGPSTVAVLGVFSLLFVCTILVARYPRVFVSFVRGCVRPLGTRALNFSLPKAEALALGLAGLRSLKRLAAVVALTILFWVIGLAIIALWIWAFDIQVPWFAPIVLMAFLSLGLALPSAPGNIGVYHWLVIQAFLALGVTQGQSGPYAVIDHAMALLPFTLLAIPLLYRDATELRKPAPNAKT